MCMLCWLCVLLRVTATTETNTIAVIADLRILVQLGGRRTNYGHQGVRLRGFAYIRKSIVKQYKNDVNCCHSK